MHLGKHMVLLVGSLYLVTHYTVSIFGSKSGHFWTISQSANSLIPWPILKISEYFYVVNGIFSLKNAIEIIFRRFWKKKFKNFFENFWKKFFCLENIFFTQIWICLTMKNAESRHETNSGGCIWSMSIRNSRKTLLMFALLDSRPSSILAVRFFILVFFAIFQNFSNFDSF